MKLHLITEDAPRLLSRDSTGTVRLGFPDGSVYEYMTFDDYLVGMLFRRYGRNMGRLTSELDRLCRKPPCEVRKIR